jgi:hypothetical protein
VSVAWNVSFGFRQSAKSIIGSRQEKSFWEFHTVAPIQYGSEFCPVTASFLRLIEEDLDAIRNNARACVREAHIDIVPKLIHLPARWTQIVDEPANLISSLNELDEEQCTRIENNYGRGSLHEGPRSRSPDIYWLDLPQFELNPYFVQVFGRRLRSDLIETDGKCENELLSDPNALSGLNLVDQQIVISGLLDFISQILVTQPPCHVLGLYRN